MSSISKNPCSVYCLTRRKTRNLLSDQINLIYHIFTTLDQSPFDCHVTNMQQPDASELWDVLQDKWTLMAIVIV